MYSDAPSAGQSVPDLLRETRQIRQNLAQSIEKLRSTLAQTSEIATGSEWSWISSGPDAARRQEAPADSSLLHALTPREKEVLRLIAEGKSTKQVAVELNIAFRTAVCHRYRILQKLHLHETASLVRLAVRAGLVAL